MLVYSLVDVCQKKMEKFGMTYDITPTLYDHPVYDASLLASCTSEELYDLVKQKCVIVKFAREDFYNEYNKYDLQELKQHLIDYIKKSGIPQYIKKWNPESIVVKSPSDLQKIIQDYHPHSHIEGLPRSIKPPSYIHSKWYKETGPLSMPDFSITNDGIGHLTFYRFIGDLSDPRAKKASDKMSKLVKKYLRSDLKGLILDFRYHTGGNIWPLKSALIPLLRNSTLYCLSNKKCKRTDKTWEVMNEDGQISLGKWTGLKLPHVNIPIAVLFGSNTGSSGEFAAAMFSGRPNVKSFGMPSEGSLSSNIDAWVSEHYKFGIMYLTTSLVTTVDGKFTEQLHPDVRTKSPVSEAKQWINKKIKE